MLELSLFRLVPKKDPNPHTYEMTWSRAKWWKWHDHEQNDENDMITSKWKFQCQNGNFLIYTCHFFLKSDPFCDVFDLFYTEFVYGCFQKCTKTMFFDLFPESIKIDTFDPANFRHFLYGLLSMMNS